MIRRMGELFFSILKNVGADATQARVYLQNDNLGFEESDSLFEVLNDKKVPPNQDIKTVLEYLQE